ncbi:pyridoxamine 5'-phosphate oxidase [Mycolicibacterium anyangense]|uniref:Pyridoxamine 5'-phosphate oxidase n=1 Tax=Mycolicibacterium anyangense TaxID=1431246 RepID=A0A6N4W3L2_9MYCO|nr:pyridoxamine 5'-phosphate oxidase family protein [Mycolicibacterium anyangense]BBZ75158.1 pyridoxamine 5'-phosphate oxidase [Mycolicibacterium anyangense]
MKQQSRRRSIAMTATEIDGFLTEQRTCRVATVTAAGHPHVSPLWFAWDGASLWLYSIVDSQRWVDLTTNGRIAVVVDDGELYGELRGVEILGTTAVIGAVPRSGTPDPALTEPERLFGEKYFQGQDFVADGRHAWLQVTPTKMVSWDFRKIGQR